MAGGGWGCADGAKCSVIDGYAMTLRDNIAEALEISMDNVNDMDVTFNDFANAGADAILALPEIADLQAKLAKVIKKLSAAESEAYDLRAAIPRAYQMGVDAVLSEACWADIAVDTIVEVVTVEAIRAIQPPADLVERAKGGE